MSGEYKEKQWAPVLVPPPIYILNMLYHTLNKTTRRHNPRDDNILLNPLKTVIETELKVRLFNE